MTYAAPTLPANTEASNASVVDAEAQSWVAIRDDSDIQFEPIEIPPREIPEPNFFERALRAFFEFLGELLSPIGSLLVQAWPVLQWVLLAAVIAFVLYLVARTIGPLAHRKRNVSAAHEETHWQPDQTESLALLEDADRLAAEGRYDEATHLLLKRSVQQIAAARPDWVEPSSTARELAALPSFSQAARRTFSIIAERVERSLFALQPLNRDDWTTARAAYADFALVRIGDGA